MPLIIHAFIAMLLALGSGAVAEPAPPDPSIAGPWGVGHASFVATDANRADRELRTDVWYPVDVSTAGVARTVYPVTADINISAELAVEGLPPSAQHYRHLLVFSHAFDSASTQSSPLMEVLASHGFIVVAPEHTGNARSSDVLVSEQQAALDRVPDLSFIIDHMLARSRDQDDDFYRRIHPTRIAVLGHQFGGTAAMGMELGFEGAGADPRVVAVLPMAAEVGAQVFSTEQLASVTIPTLLLGGTADTTIPIEENARAFDAISGSQPVYRVDLVGAGHNHFTDVCALGAALIERGSGIDLWPSIGFGGLTEPYNETCTDTAFSINAAVRLQNLFAVAFFKTHVSGDLRFARFLTRAYSATNEPLIAFDKKAALATLARFKYW